LSRSDADADADAMADADALAHADAHAVADAHAMAHGLAGTLSSDAVPAGWMAAPAAGGMAASSSGRVASAASSAATSGSSSAATSARSTASSTTSGASTASRTSSASGAAAPSRPSTAAASAAGAASTAASTTTAPAASTSAAASAASASASTAGRLDAAGMADATIGRGASASCVICTTPRSGSWLLADQLLRTGIAGRPEEYFRPDWYERFASTGEVRYRHMKSHRRFVSAPAKDTRSFPEFMRRVREAAATENGVVAVKIHWQQLERVLPSLRAHSGAGRRPDAEVLESWFPNARYVLLRRADKLRQAISYHRALRSGVWWSTGDRKSRLSEHDLGDIERLRRELVGQEEQWRRFFRESGRTPLEIVYEDLARRPRATTRSVLRFLGLDSSCAGRVPRPRLKRQADGLTRELVRAYWVSRRSGVLASPSRAAQAGTPGEVTMRTDLIVVDNFYQDPVAVRDYALRQEYYLPYEEPRATRGRPVWMASRFKRAPECPFKSSPELVECLEELTGEEIDRDYWRADFPVDGTGRPAVDHRLLTRRGSLWNCCFHCKPDTGEPPGAGVHNHVVDTWNQVGPNGWSGVVYLNLDGTAPPAGGLKLWRNLDAARELEWMTSPARWQLVDSLGNVPNRLILYRGNLPHSGSAGWGSGLRDGRLCQTFFFKTLDPLARKPLALSL
jgi:LPS sulfotransferase NodH